MPGLENSFKFSQTGAINCNHTIPMNSDTIFRDPVEMPHHVRALHPGQHVVVQRDADRDVHGQPGVVADSQHTEGPRGHAV